jgi:hypothetical protein
VLSIASRQRTADIRRGSSISRASRLWIVLSSRQEIIFSNWRSEAATEKKNGRKKRRGRKKNQSGFVGASFETRPLGFGTSRNLPKPRKLSWMGGHS